MSSGCDALLIKVLEPVACTMIWGSFFFLCAYVSCARRPLLTSRGPLNIILTSLFSGVRSAFPPNLGVFCLHGWALLVIGLVFACGLATTSVVWIWNSSPNLYSKKIPISFSSLKFLPPIKHTLSGRLDCYFGSSILRWPFPNRVLLFHYLDIYFI